MEPSSLTRLLLLGREYPKCFKHYLRNPHEQGRSKAREDARPEQLPLFTLLPVITAAGKWCDS
jgi:hypothetical protein